MNKSTNAAWYYKKQSTPHKSEASGKADRIRAFIALNLQQASLGFVSISRDMNDLTTALNDCTRPCNSERQQQKC